MLIPIMENRTGKKAEHEMESGLERLIGIVASGSAMRTSYLCSFVNSLHFHFSGRSGTSFVFLS